MRDWSSPLEDWEKPLEEMYSAPRKPEPSKGFKGIGEDIVSGFKAVPDALKSLLSELPGEAKGFGAQAFTEPTRPFRNAFLGLDKGARGLLNSPSNIANYLASKDLISEKAASRFPRTLEYDLEDALGLENRKPGDALVQSLTAAAPYIFGGELGALGTAGRIGARSGAQGAFAVGQNENPITAALMVPGIELPLRGAPALYRAAKPTNLFRGNLPAEELAANMRAAEGTSTDLGNIIGSPALKQIFENVTTKWPGSGADELLSRQASQVTGRAEDLLNRSGAGLAPGERNLQLKTALESAYESQRQQKNALYEPVNQLSQQEGFFLELPSFRSRASQQLNEIANSPLMQYDLDFRNAFNRLQGLTEGAEGAPSILEANMMADRLHNEGARLLGSPAANDRAIGSLYQDLARRTSNDIRNELRQHGSPELNEAYRTATDNYRENFSQYLDKDVYKLTRPDVEAETIIKDIIRPGKSGDKFSRIEKINNALPPEQRNILGNAWLANAIDKEGSLNPKQFAQMINKLGPRQFEALFPDPAFRQQLLDYGRLRGMNEKALSRMANPLTGQQLSSPAMIAAQVSGVINSLGSGNLPLAAGMAIGPQVGSNLLNKILTNPATRERFITQMLENEARPRTPQGPRKAVPFLSTQNYDVYDEEG